VRPPFHEEHAAQLSLPALPANVNNRKGYSSADCPFLLKSEKRQRRYKAPPTVNMEALFEADPQLKSQGRPVKFIIFLPQQQANLRQNKQKFFRLNFSRILFQLPFLSF